MITILLVIIILAVIGHILEFDFSNTKLIDFSSIRKRFKSKEKSSPSDENVKDSVFVHFPVITPAFSVPIHFNTPINILEMVGLDKYRWIVDNVYGLNIRGQNVDISNFCTIGTTRTIVFFIGENNKFSLSVSFDSGETIIKTNSKEIESEVAILTFEAKSICKSPKDYYGKASLEFARMAQKKLKESENNKIGDDNV